MYIYYILPIELSEPCKKKITYYFRELYGKCPKNNIKPKFDFYTRGDQFIRMFLDYKMIRIWIQIF